MRAKLESGQGWNILAIMLRVYKEEGLHALWSGTLPSLLLVVNPVLQHFCYGPSVVRGVNHPLDDARSLSHRTYPQRPPQTDQLKRITLTHRRATAATAAGVGVGAALTLSSLEAFSFGALAKAVATVVSYPLQVAQSRLRQQQQQQHQQQSSNEGEGEEDRIGSRVSYRGTADCLADLWRRKGVAGLFQGIEAKLLQTVLTSAFMFAGYEGIYRDTKRAIELSGGAGGGGGGAAPKLLA